MNSLFHYCQGESHKSTKKACQDCAYAESSESLSMAIVSDGHGGERYFRSKYGSELAIEITKNAIRDFVKNMEDSSFKRKMDRSVFEDESFTSYSAATATDEQLGSKAHGALMWLFSHIISKWNDAIAKDARERDLDKWELEHVEQQYKDEFLAMRESSDATFEKTYGCTLMAYVQTPEYWFAFHLGDGKGVFMRLVDGNLVFEQPIPWDDRCFLNKTTSLCDSDALNEFRYCYQGNGEFPRAVFLGSDGLDDSYGDGENLYNFYIELFKLIIKKDADSALKELKRSLPKISKVGSKDDMSVACVYDDSAKHAMFNYLINYQIDRYTKLFNEAEDKVLTLQKKIEEFGNPEKLDNSQKINYDYANKDLLRIEERAQKIRIKISNLKRENTNYRKEKIDSINDIEEPDDLAKTDLVLDDDN